MYSDQICKNCMWYQGGSAEGSCRRFPPVALAVPEINALTQRPVGMAIKGFWAPVGARDSCGEWAAKVKATAIPMPAPAEPVVPDGGLSEALGQIAGHLA